MFGDIVVDGGAEMIHCGALIESESIADKSPFAAS